MKIQANMVLCIGGTAAAVTALVLALAAFKLSAIFTQLDEQNENLNLTHLKYNSESVAALESKLLSASVNQLFSRLQTAAAAIKLAPSSTMESLKDALKGTDLAIAVIYRELPSKAMSGGELDVKEMMAVRKDAFVVEEKASERMPPDELLRALASGPAPNGVLIPANPDGNQFKSPMYAAISLPSQNGSALSVMAFALYPDFIFKAIRPASKIKTPQDAMAFSISNQNGASLLTSVSKNCQPPDELLKKLANFTHDGQTTLPRDLKSSMLHDFLSADTKNLWMVSCTPLDIPVSGADSTSLLKAFPIPKTFEDMNIAASAQIKLEDLTITIGIIALLGLLLFFPPLILISKGISEPIKNAARFSNTLAKGEFPSSSLTAVGPDEISELAKSLNHMRDRLSNTISKLKKSHEREAQARKDAEAANHLKSDFLANMSLELRNPLNSIMGFSSLILKDSDKGMYDAGLRGKVKTINESAESLNNLVSTLLDLSKLDTANLEPDISEFETAALMRELVEINLPLASEKSVTIENHYSPDAPAMLTTDRDMLEHILSLTIGSLVKSGPGGGKISFGCTTSGDRVAFWVKDLKSERSGDSLAEMYIKYGASHSEMLPTLAGTILLNLAIVKNHAHVLGADFEAASNDEANSIFSISFLKNEVLPASSNTETAAIHTASNWQRMKAPTSTQANIFDTSRKSRRDPDSPVKVLMAEDNEANRMLVELMLKDTNCSLDCVPDGLSCLESLASKKYDILLLDLHMPRLDGYSVLSKIRQDSSFNSMPIVVLTAYLEEGDKEKLIQMGANKCILKPINLDEILNTIRMFTA